MARVTLAVLPTSDRTAVGEALLAEAKSPSGRLSAKEVIAKLKTAGYPDVHSIELEHGRYEVQARDDKRRKMSLFVDPKTAAVLYKTVGWTQLRDSYLAIRDILAEVKSAGFSKVYAVEHEHSMYEVIAHDPKKGPVKLYVHPKTGPVIRHGKTEKPLIKKVREADAAGPYFPLNGVLAKIEKAGMKEVYVVYPEHNMYEFIARDKNGELVMRHVDPKTGEIFNHP